MSEKEKNVNDVDLENEVRNDDKQEISQEQEMQKLKQELDDILIDIREFWLSLKIIRKEAKRRGIICIILFWVILLN